MVALWKIILTIAIYVAIDIIQDTIIAFKVHYLQKCCTSTSRDTDENVYRNTILNFVNQKQIKVLSAVNLLRFGTYTEMLCNPQIVEIHFT